MQTKAKFIDNLQTQIKTRVKDKELTIAELERMAGLKAGAILNIMNGRSNNPGIEFVATIAKTLNCSVDELINSTISADGNQEDTDHDEASHDSKQVAWDVDLYQDCTNKVLEHLKNKNITPDHEKVSSLIREVYLFAMEGNETKADPRFTKWLVDSYFK